MRLSAAIPTATTRQTNRSVALLVLRTAARCRGRSPSLASAGAAPLGLSRGSSRRAGPQKVPNFALTAFYEVRHSPGPTSVSVLHSGTCPEGPDPLGGHLPCVLSDPIVI